MMPPILSPTFRSRKFGHRELRARQIIAIALITWLVPPLLGVVSVFLGSLLDQGDPQGVLLGILAMGSLLLFAPFYGLMAVPLALLLGAWAMQFGFAGWTVAVGTSAVLPVLIGALYQALDPTAAAMGAMLVLTPLVVIHAVILWLATRLIAPQSLLP